MARDPERPDLDREDNEDVRGFEDEDFDAEDEGDEADLEDEEQYDADERLTGEVGSEGGSPGEKVFTRRRGEQVRGSEATETWAHDQDRSTTLERTGAEGQPKRRNP